MVRNANGPERPYLSEVELSPWPFPVAPPLDVPTTLAVLAEGAIDPVGAIPWSSNAAIITQIQLDDHTVTAVCKPQAGEQPLADFPDGTLCAREVAAYRLAGEMGLDLIPETVLRDTPWGPAAVQRFVPHHPDVHYFTLRDHPEHHRALRALALLDIVANNTDRKGGHVLLDTDTNNIRGIDHGLTFHLQWKLRTVIWEHQSEPFAEDERTMLSRIIEADLAGPFGELLSPLEIDALRMRAEAALASGAFPGPSGTHRDVPWPLV